MSDCFAMTFFHINKKDTDYMRMPHVSAFMQNNRALRVQAVSLCYSDMYLLFARPMSRVFSPSLQYRNILFADIICLESSF